jgi:hypothetical protein
MAVKSASDSTRSITQLLSSRFRQEETL